MLSMAIEATLFKDRIRLLCEVLLRIRTVKIAQSEGQ